MIFEGQQRLPALSDFSMIKAFLKTDIKYCILVDFQLAEIGDIIQELKNEIGLKDDKIKELKREINLLKYNIENRNI